MQALMKVSRVMCAMLISIASVAAQGPGSVPGGGVATPGNGNGLAIRGPVVHSGFGAIDMTWVPLSPTNLLVVDVSGIAQYYDAALNPTQTIPVPGRTAVITGVAYNPNNAHLYWYDPSGVGALYETAIDGTPLQSNLMLKPTPGTLAGMTVDPTTNTLWIQNISNDVFYEFTLAGVATGNSASNPGGSPTYGMGLALDTTRGQRLVTHGSVAGGRATEITALDPTGSATALSFSIAAYGTFVTGISYSPAGSDGDPSVYIYDNGSNTIWEIDLPACFIRGDCNGDGVNDLADVIFMLSLLFAGGVVSSCDAACDSNSDGLMNLGDVIYALTHLFAMGPPPAAPYPGCGIDPTGALPCGFAAGCPSSCP
ncbi:MAG: hypothetical protein AAF581_14365 [Planctomycetota bacterium]